MKRNSRKLMALIILIAFTAAMALTGCGNISSVVEGESSEEPLTLIIANVMSSGNNVTIGVEKFAELVEEKSDGKITVDVHSDAELGNDVDTTQQVQSGSIDLCTTSSDNFGVFDPEVLALSLPYIVEKDKMDALYEAMDHGELGDYYRERFAERNLHPVCFFEYGLRCFVSANDPIATPKDMNAMKLRATSSKVELACAEALGSPAQTVPWGDTYTALQQGTVDGESNTFGLLHAAKHDEVLKYAVESEHNYSMHILMMAEDKYQALTDEQRRVIDEAAAEAVAFEREYSVQDEVNAKEAFKEKGVKIVELTPEQKEEWKKATKAVYDKLVPNIISQEVVDLIKATQK